MPNKLEVTADLVVKYLTGKLDDRERQELENWLNEAPANKEKFDYLTHKKTVVTKLRDYEAIEARKSQKWQELQRLRRQGYDRPVRTLGRLRPLFAAAVLITAVFGFFLFKYFNRDRHQPQPELVNATRYKNDVAPGSDRAVLTLGDGTKVLLDNAANGALASQDGVQVLKLDSGQLAYKGSGTGGMLYNTVTTPPGGQYMLTLPDGTKVWLNASSSLHFPVDFTGSQRVVELTGEGYFEVAKKSGQSFVVKMRDDNQVKVLGTHFNVLAYSDEDAVRTTLLEGSVAASRRVEQVLLVPGQQSVAGSSSLKVQAVDAEKAVAWKNGVFQFNGEDITAAMRQIKRWYNIDVVYEGNFKGGIQGTISRKSSLVHLLNLLEMTGQFTFSVEGQKVTVYDAKNK